MIFLPTCLCNQDSLHLEVHFERTWFKNLTKVSCLLTNVVFIEILAFENNIHNEKMSSHRPYHYLRNY